MTLEKPLHQSRRPLASTWRFTLTAALLAAPVLGGLAGCTGHEDEKVSEGDLQAVRSNLLPNDPTPKNPVNADLDGKLVYLGSDYEPAVAEPGKQLRITNYWKAVEPPGEGWRIFTHLEGPNHQGFLNDDHGAIAGKYPVDHWKAGDIVRDQRTVTLPANWTAPSVLIYVGAWRGQTRLAVKSGPSDGNNRVLALTIPVKKP